MSGERFTGAEIAALRVLLGKVGLAQPSGWLPMMASNFLPGAGTTTDQTAYTITLSRPLTVHYWYQNVYITGTNNGSNYWVLTMKRFSDLATLATLDTSGVALATSTNLAATGINAALTMAHLGIRIECAKSGSPGTLYLGGPAVFVT